MPRTAAALLEGAIRITNNGRNCGDEFIVIVLRKFKIQATARMARLRVHPFAIDEPDRLAAVATDRFAVLWTILR